MCTGAAAAWKCVLSEGRLCLYRGCRMPGEGRRVSAGIVEDQPGIPLPGNSLSLTCWVPPEASISRISMDRGQPRVYVLAIVYVHTYVNREPDGGSCWMPGETLEQGSSRFERVPFDRDSSPSDQPSNSAILDAIKGIQDGVDMKMSAIGDKLDTVSDRLKELESRQKVLEDDLRASSSSAAPSPRMPVPGKRVRRTPPALQVLDTFLYLLTNTFLFTEQNSTDSFIF